MKTFHENKDEDDNRIFRLSYHGNSHYNSIVPANHTFGGFFNANEAGKIEQEAIQWSQQNAENDDDNETEENHIPK